MAEHVNRHTSTAWAAAKNPWNGARWERLWGIVAGLLPDLYREGARLSARMMLPLPGTHPEAIGPLLRAFGLPGYAAEQPLDEPAGYFAALARLRDAWATHAVAGATAMLEAELVRAGVADAEIVNMSGDTEAADFAVRVPGSGDPSLYDAGHTFNSGRTFDRQITPTESQGIRAVIAYFKPARSLFRAVVGPEV